MVRDASSLFCFTGIKAALADNCVCPLPLLISHALMKGEIYAKR